MSEAIHCFVHEIIELICFVVEHRFMYNDDNRLKKHGKNIKYLRVDTTFHIFFVLLRKLFFFVLQT